MRDVDDAEVRKGRLTDAYIAWYVDRLLTSIVMMLTRLPCLVLRYFILAHEIAHNLVSAHNSEHEFYFSSICEQFLPVFMQLIANK